MHRLKKILAGVAALAALALCGAAIAGATGGNGSEASDAPDQAITGPAAKKAGDAALAAVGDGDVESVEATDEASPAAYEVKVSRDGGKVIEVQVAKDFSVVAQKPDDEGDGERAD